MEAPEFPLKVFYDGSCMVCASEMGHYQKRDHEGRLVAIDISQPGFDPAPYGVSCADFMYQLHAIDRDGRIFRGVEAFQAIWQAFPSSTVYSIMGRVIRLPLVNGLARTGYRLFARIRPFLPKRHRCDSGSCSVHHRR